MRGQILSLEELNLLVGTNNGKVEILKYVGKIKNLHHYEVRCNYCGRTWKMMRHNVSSGCGCLSCMVSLKSDLEDIVGTNNGKVKVLKYLGKINGQHYYDVQCNQCQKVWEMQRNVVRKGCGCVNCSGMNNDYNKIRLKYNLSVEEIHSLVKRYSSMMDRCYDTSNSSYHNYGGRGIKVCSEWIKSKLSYMEHLCSIGFNIDLEIDRINNDDNYEPSNVKFVTRTMNNLNKRTNNKHPLIYELNNRKSRFRVRIKKIGYDRCFLTLSDAIKTRDKLIVDYKLVDYYELLNT